MRKCIVQGFPLPSLNPLKKKKACSCSHLKLCRKYFISRRLQRAELRFNIKYENVSRYPRWEFLWKPPFLLPREKHIYAPLQTLDAEIYRAALISNAVKTVMKKNSLRIRVTIIHCIHPLWTHPRAQLATPDFYFHSPITFFRSFGIARRER